MPSVSSAFSARVGSSPLIVGDRIILCQDHDLGSFLMAINKKTGEIIWNKDRSEFPRNYCTPIIWENAGKKQIVIAATLRVVGYDLETGNEAWTVRGISRMVSCSPTVGDDGMLYVAGWAAGGDENERISAEPFDSVAELKDTDKSGTLEESELKDGPIHQRFSQADRHKDGKLTKAEYEYFRNLFADGKNVVISIKPGASGEATDSHVVWRHSRLVPFCARLDFYDQGWRSSAVPECKDRQATEAAAVGSQQELLCFARFRRWQSLSAG